MRDTLRLGILTAALVGVTSCAPATGPQVETGNPVACSSVPGSYTGMFGSVQITFTIPQQPPPPGFKHNVNDGERYFDGACDGNYLDLYPDGSVHSSSNLQTKWLLTSAVPPSRLHVKDVGGGAVPSPTPGLDADFN